jgi:hypothetical protein
MKVSVALCIYNDFDFIQDCVKRVYDFAEEIVILDGPYEYCEPMLKNFGLYYENCPGPLKAISNLPKVRYEYVKFKNEKEKRLYLYEMCTHDIVMLLDSDEIIIDIKPLEVKRFFESNKSVAYSTFYNLARRDCIVGLPTKKYIFFKRNEISALEHLNYTWLVGVQQDEPDRKKMYDISIMDIAHLTLMRSPFFNMVKFCFYTRLYFYTKGMFDQLDKLFGISFSDIRLKELTPVNVQDIFRKSIPALVNFPLEAPLIKCILPNLGLEFDTSTHINFLTEQDEIKVLDSVESFHYIDVPKALDKGDRFTVSFKTRGISTVLLKLIAHGFSSKEEQELLIEISANGDASATFTLPFDKKHLFGVLLCFNAKCNETGIGTIKSFIFKKKMAIYGNCQIESLKEFLFASSGFSDRFEYIETPGGLVHLMTEENVQDFYRILPKIDFLIIQPIAADYRGSDSFGSAKILGLMSPEGRVFMMPNLFFTGYAPDVYCLTYRKQFLLEPMPIHDVNLIYSYLKYNGLRSEIKNEYTKKLGSSDFYSKEFLVNHVKNNIDSLVQRENKDAALYSDTRVRFFFYSQLLSRYFDEELLHYSDAHPTEFVFSKIAGLIFEDMGLKYESAPIHLKEKGVTPFYKSVEQVVDFSLTREKIYINSQPISLDQFIESYCDAYDRQSKNDLLGYIENKIVKVVITNHKTGTLLMQRILRDYCITYNKKLLELNDILKNKGAEIEPSYGFGEYDFIFITHIQHFVQLMAAVPHLKYRTVHLIRNPFEIIMSGVRYHQITDEKWCNEKVFVKDATTPWGYSQITNYGGDSGGQSGDFTYKQIMNNLTEKEKVKFEILNHKKTFGTINEITSFLKNVRFDNNILNVRLEDISRDECTDYLFHYLSLDEGFKATYTTLIKNKNWLGDHVTDQGKTYKDIFDTELLAIFDTEFGKDVLQIFGYDENAEIPLYLTSEIRNLNANERIENQVEPTSIQEILAPEKLVNIKTENSQNQLIEEAIKSLKTNNLDFDQYYGLGEILYNSREFRYAYIAFKKCVDRDDKNISGLGRLADTCVDVGYYQEAVSYYRAIEDIASPIPSWVYIGLGNAYICLQDKDRAMSSFKTAKRLDPNNLMIDIIISKL